MPTLIIVLGRESSSGSGECRARWADVGRKQVDRWVFSTRDGLRKVTDWQGGLEEGWMQEASAAMGSRGLCSKEKL